MNDRYYWEGNESSIEVETSTPPADMHYKLCLATFGSVWRQGEHVVLIGPTGSGKTYVSPDILRFRSHVYHMESGASHHALSRHDSGEDD